MLYASLSRAESVYYVQSASAKVLSEPSFKSVVVATVAMGDMLSATGKEGSWVKVNIAGKAGYVSALLLSAHPPLKKTQVVKADEPEIVEGVRRRSSTFASAAAARGLTKGERQRADGEEGSDFSALKKMEALTYTEAEVTRFAEGGQ
jgi:hypothetical protein